MIKEFIHVFRTYFITFRYIKKKELFIFWILVYLFILYFLFYFFFFNIL